jgi:protection-of-telomeres protein 1
MTETGQLNMPFVNSKYRARVRVVDFWPMNLSSWSRSLSDPISGKPALSKEDREKCKNQFEWCFALFVEDANPAAGKTPDRLMLTMGNDQGQCLLKMDACK